MGVRLVERIERGYTQVYRTDDLYGDDKIGTAIQVWRADVAEQGFQHPLPPIADVRTRVEDDEGLEVVVSGIVEVAFAPAGLAEG